jgi:hypothetical protein
MQQVKHYDIASRMDTAGKPGHANAEAMQRGKGREASSMKEGLRGTTPQLVQESQLGTCCRDFALRSSVSGKRYPPYMVLALKVLTALVHLGHLRTVYLGRYCIVCRAILWVVNSVGHSETFEPSKDDDDKTSESRTLEIFLISVASLGWRRIVRSHPAPCPQPSQAVPNHDSLGRGPRGQGQ